MGPVHQEVRGGRLEVPHPPLVPPLVVPQRAASWGPVPEVWAGRVPPLCRSCWHFLHRPWVVEVVAVAAEVVPPWAPWVQGTICVRWLLDRDDAVMPGQGSGPELPAASGPRCMC